MPAFYSSLSNLVHTASRFTPVRHAERYRYLTTAVRYEAT